MIQEKVWHWKGKPVHDPEKDQFMQDADPQRSSHDMKRYREIARLRRAVMDRGMSVREGYFALQFLLGAYDSKMEHGH
jgi:hypothetical protein